MTRPDEDKNSGGDGVSKRSRSKASDAMRLAHDWLEICTVWNLSVEFGGVFALRMAIGSDGAWFVWNATRCVEMAVVVVCIAFTLFDALRHGYVKRLWKQFKLCQTNDCDCRCLFGFQGISFREVAVLWILDVVGTAIHWLFMPLSETGIGWLVALLRFAIVAFLMFRGALFRKIPQDA
jgi:hypothetical protein